MKILVVGGGGREHALCWALSASPLCEVLFCAPGNGGIAQHATCVDIAAEDIDGVVRFARDRGIDFVVVGPEAPLVLGLVDRLEESGIAAFGPSAAAAALEGSKSLMKDLCRRHGIPTAAWQRFTDPSAAIAYVRNRGVPIVVKADGLAAGKGVTVATGLDQAIAAVEECLVRGRFDQAGQAIVVEECLVGEEVSFMALVDGETALPLASAQDHKAVGDGDTGANTGGMGAYSPAPALTPALERRIMAEIIEPAVRGLAEDGRRFKGVLYAGLMLVPGPHGPDPKLLEFNVRFGDPECQVLLPRLAGDLLPVLLAAREGTLDRVALRWRAEAALCVVLAARGYPGAYRKGTEIKGLDGAASAAPTGFLFHAGTRRDPDGVWRAAGGRVLGATALGADIAEAQRNAYRIVAAIDWPDGFWRRDIGWRALARTSPPG